MRYLKQVSFIRLASNACLIALYEVIAMVISLKVLKYSYGHVY